MKRRNGGDEALIKLQTQCIDILIKAAAITTSPSGCDQHHHRSSPARQATTQSLWLENRKY
jgi:hypothetical protein